MLFVKLQKWWYAVVLGVLLSCLSLTYLTLDLEKQSAETGTPASPNEPLPITLSAIQSDQTWAFSCKSGSLSIVVRQVSEEYSIEQLVKLCHQAGGIATTNSEQTLAQK